MALNQRLLSSSCRHQLSERETERNALCLQPEQELVSQQGRIEGTIDLGGIGKCNGRALGIGIQQ